jgi:hypothetical protein
VVCLRNREGTYVFKVNSSFLREAGSAAEVVSELGRSSREESVGSVSEGGASENGGAQVTDGVGAVEYFTTEFKKGVPISSPLSTRSASLR